VLVAPLRVLYLARYAPPDPSPYACDAGVAPLYHREIYEILKELPISLESATDPSRLFDPTFTTDYVFFLYNKAPYLNSEVFVAAVCEFRRFSYLGAPPHIRAVAEDKHLAKIVACHLDIETPPWKVYRLGTQRRTPPPFAGPYIVKPRFGSASEHIDETSLASTWGECLPLIDRCFDHRADVIVEEFIDGWNMTIPIIATPDPRALPAVRATSDRRGNIITYRQKRLLDDGLRREVWPADTAVARAQEIATRLHRNLMPLDYSRVDFRWDDHTGKLLFLELNVCCNLGSHSSFALSAAATGYSQASLVELILRSSLSRQQLQWQHF
jgi:D-alanine-D-alanine ligase